MVQVDLNCDMGESFGTYILGSDKQILEYVSSANIACGFHAGDPTTMRKTVALALDKGVAIGAHPGLQDLIGFGRRNIDISKQEAYDIVTYQIGALSAFIKAEGGKMNHVKPHGSLYNMAAINGELAKGIAEAVYNIDPELILFGLANGKLLQAGEEIGLQTASEVFADRTYQSDGTLTNRKEENALIVEEDIAVNQVIRMIKENKVQCCNGTDIEIASETICIHGDGVNALGFARNLKARIEEAGIIIQAKTNS